MSLTPDSAKEMTVRRIIIVTFVFLISACSGKNWREADRSSTGLAPKASELQEAIVQLYAARAFSWRGLFAVHSWIATKNKGEESYTVYHVMGWRLRQGKSVVSIQKDLPDRRWYDAEPKLLYELKGEKAAQLIPRIHQAALDYPYAHTYRAWPGPNSNTFISYILRKNPEIGVELPPHAIGRDWLEGAKPVGLSETSTGVQVSLLGALGFSLGLGDGIELNLLGLSFGLDILRPALKVPLVGRLGFSDQPVFDY